MPSATVDLVRRDNVELIRVGTWDISTGRWDVSREDLAAAIAATKCPAVRRPHLKMGHVDKRFTPSDGEPALGWIENLRLTDGGTTLVGDYTGVPGWLGDVMASAYPDRSVEGTYNMKCQLGHTHPFALTAVALLGVTPPGVGTLKSLMSLDDVKALYGVAAGLGAPADGEVRIVASIAGDVVHAHLPGRHDQKDHGRRTGKPGREPLGRRSRRRGRTGGSLTGQAALDAAPAKLTPPPEGHTGNYAGEKLTAPPGAGSARALSEYEGVEYEQTNRFLRGGYRDVTGDEDFLAGVPERIADIDKTMSVSPLEDDVVVYRAIRHGRDVFGRDEWYRGVIDWENDDFDVQDAQFEEWEAGKRPDLTGLRWAERGYSSTTANPERPAIHGRRWPANNTSIEGEPVIMAIHVPKGTGAVQLSGMDLEAELLLQRDLVMEITADHGVDEAGFRRIDVSVVSADA